MLRSDWGIVVTIVGCLGLAGLALWDVKSQPKRAIYCESSTSDTNCRPQQYDTERSGIPSFFERSISNPEPKTGADHEKRDLAAQEASAVFSFWMMIIAGCSTIVTFIGTILLYQQIKLTREAVEDTGLATEAMREANDIAREGTKLAQANLDMGRPFILFIGFESAMCANSQGDQYWVFTFKWKNFGQIPASIQQGSIRRIVLSHGMFATNEVQEFEIPSDPIETVSKDFMAKDITREFSIMVSDLEIYTDHGRRAALPGTVSVISRISYRNPIDMFAGPYVSQYAINFSFVMPGDGERGVKGHRALPDLIYST
jgi:hypothetical protein